jgi:cell shape-determining protein MreD
MKKLYVVAIVTGIIAGFLLDVMSAVIEGQA